MIQMKTGLLPSVTLLIAVSCIVPLYANAEEIIDKTNDQTTKCSMEAMPLPDIIVFGTTVLIRSSAKRQTLCLAGREVPITVKFKHKRLYEVGFDTNFDGHVNGDDEKPVKIGENLTLDLPGEKGTTPFRIRVTFNGIMAGPYLSGLLGDQRLVLFDSNLNGSFCDVGVDCYCLGPDKPLSNHLSTKVLVKHLDLDSKIMTLSCNDKEACLKPYTGPLSSVSMKPIKKKEAGPSRARYRLINTDSGYSAEIDSGQQKVVVPSGSYLVQSCDITINGGVTLGSDGPGKVIKITEGDCKLSFGSDFQLDFSARLMPDGSVRIDRVWLNDPQAEGGRYKPVTRGHDYKVTASLVANKKVIGYRALSYA